VSRTKRGEKGSGFEYWGKRPSKIRFADPGPENKKITHKQERAEKKRKLLEEKRNLDESA
jgi:hypothetical protein